MNLGNVKHSAIIAALQAIEKQNPGFINYVKKLIPKRLKAHNQLNGIIDDFNIFDSDTFSIADILGTGESTGESVVDTVTGTVKEWGTAILDLAQTAVPAYINYQNQREWSKLQLERAKQGLAPLPTAGFTAPATVVRVQLPAGEIQRAVGISDDTKNQMMIGALILGGLFLIGR